MPHGSGALDHVGSGACPILASERVGLVQANAELGPALEQGWEGVNSYLTDLGRRLLTEGTSSVLADAPLEDLSRLENVVRQRRDLERRGEALRQGFKGWTDETMAMVGEWDFDVADVGVHVDWWHGANDKTVPLAAVQRLTARYRTLNCTSSIAVLTTSTWQHSWRERWPGRPSNGLGMRLPHFASGRRDTQAFVGMASRQLSRRLE